MAKMQIIYSINRQIHGNIFHLKLDDFYVTFCVYFTFYIFRRYARAAQFIFDTNLSRMLQVVQYATPIYLCKTSPRYHRLYALFSAAALAKRFKALPANTNPA